MLKRHNLEQTYFGSSSDCGPSRALPAGFFSASSAVKRVNSASILP